MECAVRLTRCLAQTDSGHRAKFACGRTRSVADEIVTFRSQSVVAPFRLSIGRMTIKWLTRCSVVLRGRPDQLSIVAGSFLA